MWTAQQDCRSFRNTGIFTSENPDQYGNQNQWAIYADGYRIMTVEEAGPGRPQEVVDAQAHLVESVPELLNLLKRVIDEQEYGIPDRLISPELEEDIHTILQRNQS